ERRRDHRLLPRQDRWLQDPEVGRLLEGAAAKDRARQDCQAPAARSVLGWSRAQDMKLWHREGGAGAQRLVLIHGMGANADVWMPLEKHLQGRWLAPDLRGHGRSPHAAPYSFAGYAADVADLLRQDEEGTI